MCFKVRIFTILIACFLSVGSLFSLTVFAEGETVCTGKISGSTPVNNVNAGLTSFDAHPDANGVSLDSVDLTVAGENGKGLAPANRLYAACTEKKNGTDANSANAAYEYAVKGFAWNTNLGFLSFSCEGGKNNPGSPLDCGVIDYGVYLGPAFAGKRTVFGYAWSPSFGWVQFGYGWHAATNEWLPATNAKCKDATPCTNVTTLDAVGNITGYAWTQAGIYMNFGGLKMDLPADNIVDPTNDGDYDCTTKPWLSVCAVPDPTNIDPDPGDYGDPDDFFDSGVVSGGADADLEVKIADGVDGYYIHLYLRDALGAALTEVKYNFNEFSGAIQLNWDDTVKLNQTNGSTVGDVLDGVKEPIKANNATGAIVWKPLTFADFEDDPTDPVAGHYRSKQLVRSYAPTSDANISFTSGTKKTYPVLNEQFIDNVGASVSGEKNQLILKSITFNKDLVDKLNGNAVVFKKGAVYPNGKIGMSFKFKPAIFVSTLYSGVLQDVLDAFRSLPVNVKFGLSNVANAGSAIISNTEKVDLKLAYSVEKTKLQAGCGGDDGKVNGFDFQFLQNDLVDLDATTSKIVANAVNLFGKKYNLPVVATIPDYDNLSEEEKLNALPCSVAAAPTLYSVIKYSFPNGAGVNVPVSYYSNKLPRIGDGKIFNPIAVVHGSLVGQAVADVRYGSSVELSGSSNVTTVKDAIYENLKKQGVTLAAAVSVKDCYVKYMSFTANSTSLTIQDKNGQPCSNVNDYKITTIGNEKVVYFKGHNVHLDLSVPNPDGGFVGRWVFINDGGNFFIDNDIRNADTTGKSLVMVALSNKANFDTTGNVYLGPCPSANKAGPKNVQATVIADGSLFPYTGDVAQINAKGEPIYSDFQQRISQNSCQTLWEGNLRTDNTVGGADIDTGDDPKPYVLLGGGEVIETPVSFDERLRAQLYDLNYLRLFTLDLETGENGCPIDQTCGKSLCAEEVVKIANGENVCGEKTAPFAGGVCGPVAQCNGINPYKKYSGTNDFEEGDLVVKAPASALAKGLNNAEGGEDFDPIYIFQRDFAKDSFVFKKAGQSSLGN